MISIIPVSGKKLLSKFIDFPHVLYQNDPYYVPELFIAQRDILTPGKHPFHEHSVVKLFLACEDGIIKGRIAAILNNNHNQFNKSNEGFFGFFDCENNTEVSTKLFLAAAAWLKEQGVKGIIGPVNPTTNDPTGLLIDGFDSAPMAMMPYNKPYYAELIKNSGFVKKVDLVAYYLDTKTTDDKPVRLHNALLTRLEKRNITIRTINIKDFKNETARIRDVYNAAWDHNMGFVPMTEHEFKYLAKDLKMILDPDLCLVAEHEGKIVGFALAIPDINQILIKIKRGRLLPFGIFKLLLGRKKINRIRILALGVIEGYKKAGIEACFYASIIEKARKKHILGGEASWILEDNFLMNKGIQDMAGKVYKTYRLYEKEI